MQSAIIWASIASIGVGGYLCVRKRLRIGASLLLIGIGEILFQICANLNFIWMTLRDLNPFS